MKRPVFSFFRKNKPEDLMAFLKEGQPDASEGPAYSQVGRAAEREHGIEVHEAGGGLEPEFEDAAVLFANGKIGETATLLNRYLLDHPDNRDPLPWYMLFDLYQASNQAAPFEDAAVDFAVKFERSPPTWCPPGENDKPANKTVPLMSYGEKYGSLERVRQPRFMQEAEVAPYVRMDLSKTAASDEETARAILNDIVRLNEMAKPVELIGAPGFAVRLNAARQVGRLGEPGWFLYMAVLQLQGKEKEFEDAAVDYAVAYEVSPRPTHRPCRCQA